MRPDGTVEALSVIGLSFLLFLAGLEIDLERWRGAARLVALGLAGTVALTAAAAVGWSLDLAGLVESPLLVGIALAATSLGLLIPVLKDAGAADRPAGQLVIGERPPGSSARWSSVAVLLPPPDLARGRRIGRRQLLPGRVLTSRPRAGAPRSRPIVRPATPDDRPSRSPHGAPFPESDAFSQDDYARFGVIRRDVRPLLRPGDPGHQFDERRTTPCTSPEPSPTGSGPAGHPRRPRPPRRHPRRRRTAHPALRASRRHRAGHGQHHRRRHLPAPGLHRPLRHHQPPRLRRADRRRHRPGPGLRPPRRTRPRTGGPYVYAREAFGDFAGFLAAWAYWITTWVSNAALAVAAVGYLDVLIPVGEHRWTACLAALVIQWLPALANYAGTRYVGAVQVVSTVLKLVPLVLVAVGGLFFFDAGATSDPSRRAARARWARCPPRPPSCSSPTSAWSPPPSAPARCATPGAPWAAPPSSAPPGRRSSTCSAPSPSSARSPTTGSSSPARPSPTPSTACSAGRGAAGPWRSPRSCR